MLYVAQTLGEALYYIQNGQCVNVKEVGRSIHKKFAVVKNKRDSSHEINIDSLCTKFIENLNDISAVFSFTPTIYERSTLLHWAVSKRYTQIVKLLLESRFEQVLNVVGRNGSCEDIAKQLPDSLEKNEIIQLLSKYPVNKNVSLRTGSGSKTINENSVYLKRFMVEYIKSISTKDIVDKLNVNRSKDDPWVPTFLQDKDGKANKEIFWMFNCDEPPIISKQSSDVPGLPKEKGEILQPTTFIYEKPYTNFDGALIESNHSKISLNLVVPNIEPISYGVPDLDEQTGALLTEAITLERTTPNSNYPILNKRDRSGRLMPPSKQSKSNELQTHPRQISSDGLHTQTNIPKCIISSKYLEEEPLPGMLPDQSTQMSGLYEGQVHEIRPIEATPGYSAHELVLADGALTVLTTLHDLQSLQSAERLTFVRNGRGNQSLVPKEEGNGRVILVMPKSEEALARNWVNPNRDVLLINHAPGIESNELGLAGVRWWAVYHAAFELDLKNFIVMDDNLKGIHTKSIALPTWKSVYEIYQQTSRKYEAVIVSTPSFRPERTKEYLSIDEIEAQTNKYGYKLFYVQHEGLKQRFSAAIALMPPKLTWPQQDIFLQEVVRAEKLNLVKISSKSLVVQRGNMAANSCAKSYNTRNLSALVWLEPPMATYPPAYQQAWSSLAIHVNRSLDLYAREKERLASIDLGTKKTPKRANQPEPMNIEEDPKPKVIVSESLKLIDMENFRRPQRESLEELGKFLLKDFNQGYFEMPTGLGKTRVFTSLAQAVAQYVTGMSKLPKQRHILLITPSIEISAQIRSNDLQKANTVIVDSRHVQQEVLRINREFQSENSAPKIVIICQRSLAQLLAHEDGHAVLERFGLIIVDEMHLVIPTLLAQLKSFSDDTSTPMLGFSATPGGRALPYFNPLIFKYDVVQAVKENFLVPWKIRWQEPGSFNGLGATLHNVENILHDLKSSNGNFTYRGIIWVSDIHTANKLAESLRALPFLRGRVAAYHSDTLDRSSILKSFNESQINILIAVSTLREGFDSREIDFAIIAKPSLSLSAFIQMRGRALRVSPTRARKVAKIYIERGAIRDLEENVEWPHAFPGHPKLLPSTWKVVPFPLITDQDHAVNYANRFFDSDTHNKIFAKIKSEIYGNNKFSVIREALRNPQNYREYAPNLSGHYYHYFIFNRNVALEATDTTSVNYYREIEENGEKVYELIGSHHHDYSKRTINLLKKARPDGNARSANHYELLINLDKIK